MVRSTDRPAMTIAVDLGRKATNKQTNKQTNVYHSQFFIFTFGDFMKNGSKIPKLQMHENLHKNVFTHNFMQFFIFFFYGGQLKQQICYSFTLLVFYMVFYPVLVFTI